MVENRRMGRGSSPELTRGYASSGKVAKRVIWLFLLMLGPALLASAKLIRAGLGHQTIDLGGVPLEIFTYRPKSCTPSSLLLVLHGLHRNAESYRDDARPLADALCAIEVAPLFDERRFPTWRYQKGGIVQAGTLLPPAEWTGNLLLSLIDWVRKSEGQPQLAYSLIGHSGGAQFLSRFAAFVPNSARSIVIANPSTYVLPDLEVEVPFGLKGVYPPEGREAALRNYLAQPVTILLGQEDLGDKDRDDSASARAQGDTRYERGLNTFRAAQAVAQAHAWPCNWRLVEVPGVGHNARTIFASPQALAALQGNPATP
jgi:pimeloyl-ACP methyl ester carboxylesterase